MTAGTTFDGVAHIVMAVHLINNRPDFSEYQIVTNGCNELLSEVFEAAGAHVRSAFSVAKLPMGASVKIGMVVELK